jgi:hypothetical protein
MVRRGAYGGKIDANFAHPTIAADVIIGQLDIHKTRGML